MLCPRSSCISVPGLSRPWGDEMEMLALVDCCGLDGHRGGGGRQGEPSPVTGGSRQCSGDLGLAGRGAGELGSQLQWVALSVRSSCQACAPLQHWNAFKGKAQATQTPVGTCFVATDGLSRFAEYAPCRCDHMEATYKNRSYGERRSPPPPRPSPLPPPPPPPPPSPAPDAPSSTATPAPCRPALASPAQPLSSFPPTPLHVFQVASYFGHTVAVADVNGDGKDDILVGAPLYMEHRSDRKLYEVGCIYLYLQRRGPHPYRHPWQTMTGTEVYGRFGTAIAPAGDLDQDGYVDVAVGAPFAGSGRVLIFRGYSEGLRTPASQVLESPFPGHAAFGFSVRGATDIDANGYPGTATLRATPAQPVVVASSQLLVPDVLNPEEKTCTAHRTLVSCMGTGAGSLVTRGTAASPPLLTLCSPGLAADLQLDRLKPKSGRRVWELQTHQAGQRLELQLSREAPFTCQNLTAYLRDEADFKDKLSPIVVSLALTLAAGPGTEELGLVLYGQTVVQEQTRIVLDCGEDNVCIPKLRLAAHTPVAQLFIGAENVVHILADATNAGEGAFEAELRLQLPRDVHYQKATSNVQGLEKLICNLKKENETGVVICELGNPMKSGTKVGAFPPPHAPPPGCPSLGTRRQPPNSCLPPSSRCLPPAWRPPPPPSITPLSSPPIPKLHNQGPGTVSRAELRVEFPNQFQGDFLLYMMEVNTEGRINCSSPTGLNPLGVGAGICCTGRGVGGLLPGHGSRALPAPALAERPLVAIPALLPGTCPSMSQSGRELGAAQAAWGPREGVTGEMEHVVRVHLPGSDVGASQVPAGKAAPVPLSQPAASLWGCAVHVQLCWEQSQPSPTKPQGGSPERSRSEVSEEAAFGWKILICWRLHFPGKRSVGSPGLQGLQL
uniref:Integrin subunit alpha 2b n=1 Tax=Terrapene triunguis TaxID=2587831 RepID=A0A674JTF2_9SAUR